MNTENAAWLLFALAAFIIYNIAVNQGEQRKTCQAALMPYSLPANVITRACNLSDHKLTSKG